MEKHKIVNRKYQESICSWCGSVHCTLQTQVVNPGHYGHGHFNFWCSEHARKLKEQGVLEDGED
jgi:hypothetical protein